MPVSQITHDELEVCRFLYFTWSIWIFLMTQHSGLCESSGFMRLAASLCLVLLAACRIDWVANLRLVSVLLGNEIIVLIFYLLMFFFIRLVQFVHDFFVPYFAKKGNFHT